MSRILSDDERSDLIARYQHIVDDATRTVLESPQQVSTDGQPPVEFQLDEEVVYLRPDTTYPGTFREKIGTIGAFLRISNAFGSRDVALIIVDDERGSFVHYQVPVDALRKFTPPPSLG